MGTLLFNLNVPVFSFARQLDDHAIKIMQETISEGSRHGATCIASGNHMSPQGWLRWMREGVRNPVVQRSVGELRVVFAQKAVNHPVLS